MASSTPLKDIDEQFLQCCICMEQLKEPKMLPCLHRYCRDCLKKVFKEAKEIECPTCREKHTLPEGGIYGLKTDFNTKIIIEFIQLQSSVKVDPLRTCIHCKKKMEASAYCFKCNDFLCQSCHEFHASSSMVKDHHPHIFSLSEAVARNLTIQKLSSLKQAPKCDTHPDKLSELCCTTCGNLPICVPCSFGKHRGHGLEEVTSLAKIERERLTGKVADLMQYKEKIQKMQEEIKKSKEKLSENVDEERQKLQERLNAEEENIKTVIRNIDEKLKQKQVELEEKMEKTTSRRKQELEEEMREARQKYERVCKEEREKADAELKKLQQESESEKEQLQEGLDATNNNIKELLALLKTQEEESTRKIKALSDHFDDIMKRFETVTTTASSIFAAKHDWTDVQCVPDICRAIDPLIKEVKRDHPELETLFDITINDLSSDTGRIDISEKEESITDIGIPSGWNIMSIHSSKDGRIVITGKTSTDTKSHITVINRKGEQLRQDTFDSSVAQTAWRYGDNLSLYEAATACTPDEVGIYNIKDGSFKKGNISQMVGNAGPVNWWIHCVAVEESSNNILVGNRNSRSIYVCNNQLKHIHTLEIPEIIKWPRDIAVHKGNLLVRDMDRANAYAITMDKSVCEVVYKFTSPDAKGNGWKPCNVCTDKNGYIYILWTFKGVRGMIAQYDKEGGQLLTTREVDAANNALSITTVDTGHGEKILLATNRTQKLITYGLVKKKQMDGY